MPPPDTKGAAPDQGRPTETVTGIGTLSASRVPLRADSMLRAALDYANRGIEVFPLAGKVPAIAGGHGVLDATRDPRQVHRWWSGRYQHCNIGGRVPPGLFVLDVDPRANGDRTLADLEHEHGPLPVTRLTISGRGDGGRHYWWKHPGGTLAGARLVRTGLDLKTHSGYVVLPPSRHPDTDRSYTWAGLPGAVDPPSWLVELLRPAASQPARPRRRADRVWPGESPADWYNRVTSWAQLLSGWHCLDPDPDAPGARWRHPTATSRVSATVGRDGRIYVYSTNVEWADQTVTNDPHGMSRFDVYAELEHAGDRATAAHAIAAQRRGDAT